jgi:hypothetical protein
MKRYWRFAFVALSLLFLLGCANKGLARLEEVREERNSGDYAGALVKIQQNPDWYGSKDAVLYYMDQGLLLHYLGQYDSSIVYLEKAVQEIDALYGISISEEGTSFLSNDFMRAYRGRSYEKAALHQFLMLNYMAQEKWASAVVEARRAELLFERLYQQDEEGFYEDPVFYFFAALAYAHEGEVDNEQIAAYKCAKAYRRADVNMPELLRDYVAYTLRRGKRIDDLQELELSQYGLNFGGMDQGLLVVQYEGQIATIGERFYSGTYVRGGLLTLYGKDENGEALFIQGLAPAISSDQQMHLNNERQRHKSYQANQGYGQRRRQNYRSNYQASYESDWGKTAHISLALPYYKADQSLHYEYTWVAANHSVKAESVQDYSELLRSDLENSFQRTLARTAVRVALRTWVNQLAKNQIDVNNPLGNLVLNVAMDVASDQLEKADTRASVWLPRRMQLSWLPLAAGEYHLQMKKEWSSAQGKHPGGQEQIFDAFDELKLKKGLQLWFKPALY